MEGDVLPDERKLDRLVPRGRRDQGVECGVEECGVDAVSGGVGVVGEGDLGVDAVAVLPGVGEALEGGAVVVAAFGEPVIETREVSGRRAGRR
jgi:hypothetical protein